MKVMQQKNNTFFIDFKTIEVMKENWFKLKRVITDNIDYISMFIVVVMFVLNLVLPDGRYKGVPNIIVGILFGIRYVVYPLNLYFRKQVDFDWHLIHGHFLRKVCVLVLLVPALVSTPLEMWKLMNEFSPKDLVFDTDLYTYDKAVTVNLGKANNPLLHDTVYTKMFDYEIRRDSVFVKNKLENISKSQKDPSLLWSVYYHFIDPGNQHMSTSLAGRIWAAIAAILGIFLLNGLLVSSIIGWVDRRKERWYSGKIDYKLKHLGKYRFAVVIGANEIVASVIRNLLTKPVKGEINYKCERENNYILLQTSRDTAEVREMLNSYLTDDQLQKVVIFRSKRDSDDGLDRLYLEYATEIYVLGECSLLDGGESFHDSMNMRCVNLIAERLQKEKEIETKRIVCKVLFEYQTTQSVFQFSDVPSKVKNNLHFIPFNRYEAWARTVMVENKSTEDIELAKNNQSEKKKSIEYMPLDGKRGIGESSDSHVHFVVVGMSKMGIAMGLQAMLQCHYANYAYAESLNNKKGMDARRTRITFIDTNADLEMDFFKGRYENLFSLTRHRYIDAGQCEISHMKADSPYGWQDPMNTSGEKWKHLSDGKGNFIDIEIEFVKGRLESDGVREYLRQISDENNPWVNTSLLTIAICLPKTHQAVAASLYMPIGVYEKTQEVWVYQREAADIILNLNNTETKDKRYEKLRPFGMIYGEYMSDRTLYLRSLLVNGAYALGDIKIRNMADKETFKDLRDSWKLLSLDKKYSNKYFADSIYQKVRSVLYNENFCVLVDRFTKDDIECLHGYLENNEVLAICEHNRWNVQQLLLGYSPCEIDVDNEIKLLNEDCQTDSAKEARDNWRIKNNWSSLSPAERQELKSRDEEYKNLAHGKFDEKKREYKESPERLHPNICSYSHLDTVDSGAKKYDTDLNKVIPYYCCPVNF